MDIDSTPVPPPQEYSDNPNNFQSETSLSFDYLHGLRDSDDAATSAAAAPSSSSPSSSAAAAAHTTTTDANMDSSSSSSYYQHHHHNSPRHFSGIGATAAASSSVDASGVRTATSSTGLVTYGHVDDSKTLDRPFNLNERFVTVLDQLDARVEKFRKDALGLQEKRDYLLMSIDLIKSNDMLQSMSPSQHDEITCYLQRVNARLGTVELNVRTVRDKSQEESLSQINALIDILISLGDPVLSRQRCQQYLNSCCSSAEAELQQQQQQAAGAGGFGFDIDAGPVDKQFESALLGCTLDDQKHIKKRLQALMGYLNKQIVRNN